MDTAPPLPKVVLLGDSIRLGYAPLVARRLAGRAVVVSPPENGGDSRNVLDHLAAWAVPERPDLVHFNCGLHDLKRSEAGRRYQVPLDVYTANLTEIVRRLQAETGATPVFASTTPISDERHAARGAGFDRHEEDVQRYNGAALAVMRAAGVATDDLHWIVEQAGADQVLAADGTHYTPAGYERLAEAVADCVLRHLTIRRYQPMPAPAGGPEAAAAYARRQAERDAAVPAAYRHLPVPAFPLPVDATAWRARRPAVLQTVLRSLGDLPPRPSPHNARVVSRELRDGYSVEKVAIPNGVDGDVTALLLIPERLPAPAPAVLWLHSSTPDKTQVLIPQTNGGSEPLGETLVRAGYVVLSPDAYWHGDRVGSGPAGALETGRAEQESLFKLHFWFGRTLWGMFVRDDQVALDYLCSRPEVDAGRIGATGMSMGSTRAWWLAAVDERIAATVAVACLTRYQNLIAHGDLRQHGIYYFVQGLLQHFDTEAVLALIAPRPFLALTGELDAGSPADGIRELAAIVGAVYAALGAPERFRSILYPETGHTVTPQMRTELLAWFDRWLAPGGRSD
jgi:dienelactone hydrolase/lysophospholipase L1-like esterase